MIRNTKINQVKKSVAPVLKYTKHGLVLVHHTVRRFCDIIKFINL